MYPAQHVSYVVQMPKDLIVKKVAILGGAAWTKDDPAYNDSYEVAKLLAQNGYEVLNGGGPGVMEAATIGAKEGGQNFAVVVTYQPSGTHENYEGSSNKNPYDEEIKTLDYFDRTKVLLQNTDVHIIFRGGTGTISEFGMSWAISRIHEGHHKPIILFGEFWNEFISIIKKSMHMRPGEIELLHVVTKPEEVIEYIKSISKKEKQESLTTLM